ncbi:MAG: DUF4019 domain-containing protein [Chlorobiaceae bacterium]|nr:DUF4019 domain-containing protein [Chlorobiaceae bacterium]NTV59808.1 DUF4019 domain-containing protein [Chlorobiaceae bacterium]
MKKALFLSITVLLIGFIAACSRNDKAGVQVTEAKKWLSLIDGGHYTESWKTASSRFRASVSEQEWTASLESARKPLGETIGRELVHLHETTALPGAPDGRYAVMTMESVFEHKKRAEETVTFMFDTDGTWRAAGYYIR